MESLELEAIGLDPVVLGPYGASPNHGSTARTCVCDCQQSADADTCWQCGRPARGWRWPLQLTTI